MTGRRERRTPDRERRRSKGASPIEGSPTPDRGHPYGILIVDDEQAILESLELTLGSDYRVITRDQVVEEGLEPPREREEIALIIADQVLPAR